MKQKGFIVIKAGENLLGNSDTVDVFMDLTEKNALGHIMEACPDENDEFDVYEVVAKKVKTVKLVYPEPKFKEVKNNPKGDTNGI